MEFVKTIMQDDSLFFFIFLFVTKNLFRTFLKTAKKKITNNLIDVTL